MSEPLGPHARCVVCGHADSRGLSTTRLARGDVVVVCGTHELMHRRSPRRAETVAELCAVMRERRTTSRRARATADHGDELAGRLTEAFSVSASSNRRARDRRTG